MDRTEESKPKEHLPKSIMKKQGMRFSGEQGYTVFGIDEHGDSWFWHSMRQFRA